MPVYSMTGYASATAGTPEAPASTANSDHPVARTVTPARTSVTVELRSVNARFLDLSLRLPDELRALEPALRDLLTASLRRGKVELRLNAQTSSDTAWPQPQPEQLNRLSHVQSTIRGWMPTARELSINEVLNWCKDLLADSRVRAAYLGE